MTSSRVLNIRARLMAAFSPSELEVVDDSHLHVGHAGAKDGRGHFSVTIVSKEFAGRRQVECHRMVFAALQDMMRTDIHALSITALSGPRPDPE